jgi:sec-independent protein translocase protein TatC
MLHTIRNLLKDARVTPAAAAPQDDDEVTRDEPKSFVAHLEELRWTVLWSIVSFAVAAALAVPVAPRILDLIQAPLRSAGEDPDKFLRIMDMTGGLSIAMQVIVWTGLLVSAPAIVFFVARFVFPGLKRKEKRAVVAAMFFATLLFAMGVAMGYFMLLPVTIQWMLGISAWMGKRLEFVMLDGYISFVVKMLLGFGLAFEFPVLVVALGSLGIVSARFLADKRRHVAVILLVVSAIVTPTVDPVTQALVAAPLYALYEISIWIVWFMQRRRRCATSAG